MLLKSNTLSKGFVPNVKKKSTLVCFVYGRNGHLNYACTYKNITAKKV